MPAFQHTLEITTHGRGTREITQAVVEIVARAGIACGLVNVFVPHTSYSVMLTENADPSIRHDLETLAQRWSRLFFTFKNSPSNWYRPIYTKNLNNT